MEPTKKPYDIATPELIEKAMGMIEKNAKYCDLKKQLEKAERQRNYVKIMQLKQMMEAAQRAVVQKLIEQEIEERQNTEGILKMLPYDEGQKYRDYLNALCFCFDAIDYLITDINDLLKRNDIGFNVESIPEIKKCKDKVASVISLETKKMDDGEQEIYANEADTIFTYIVWRGGVFRKKADYYKHKKEKEAQKAKK